MSREGGRSAPGAADGGKAGDAAWVVGELARTTKYRYVCEDVLARTAAWAVDGRRRKDALKVAKRKLHQVFGAYGEGDWLARVETTLAAMPGPGDPTGLRAACREAMHLHASTEERLEGLVSFYPSIFSLTGKPARILDLACGLNPVTVPWMDLGPDSEYLAVDLDRRLADALSGFLSRLGSGFEARCGDALGGEFGGDWDLVLILKALPVFEQQEKGAAQRVLARFPRSWVVASFPSKSLGGKEKGMSGHYAGFAQDLGNTLRRETRMVSVGAELVICYQPAGTD